MKISDGFILDTVSGEYVAVSLDYSKEHFSGMIKLTGVSAYLWQLLKEERTERELVTAVIEKYNINEETATRDIRGFLQQLSKNGILHNDKRGDDKKTVQANTRRIEKEKAEHEKEPEGIRSTEKIERTYVMADIPFSMKSSYAFTPDMCKKYENIQPVIKSLFEIDVTQEEIEAENHGEAEDFGDDYLESLALYRKLCEKMLEYDIFLLHCSAVAVDGKAYLFTAPSGTGKSTHTRLWREYFGKDAVMVNDDKPLIQVRKDGIYVCGTPWSGKHYLDTNIKVPIQGICVLRQGIKNEIKRICRADAYAELYRQAYRPKDRQKVLKTLSLLNALAENIPMYRMSCDISREAVEVSYGMMRNI